MSDNPDSLQVRGCEIVNGRGEVVRLRGFCLGGWMNMENFITGYPGHESGMRAAVNRVLGPGRTAFFFERFLHHFIGEDDLRFLKSLGCSVVRVPFNYRHLEFDDRPFVYRPEGFALLDRVIGWARDQGLYVILDLHAAQGWQSGGWHCDNSCQQPHFWGQQGFEDRVVALWEELARRYREEPFVAGYNVMNEPVAAEVTWLNRFYRRVTDAIRAIDPHHILFLEGNHFSQQFHELDPPFDSNTVYSSHYYMVPGLEDGEYPGEFDGIFYGREQLRERYLERTAFMRQHRVPHWFGEFGCLYTGSALEPSRLRVMADQLAIAEEQGDHWTIWTYKDIGKMGLVYADAESEWMQRTRPVREAKTALRCDSWIERHETQIEGLVQGIADYARTVAGELTGEWDHLTEMLRSTICDGLMSRTLLPAFAEQFRGMSESEIDRLMQSFALQNCVRREGLVGLIRDRCAGET
jgi:endoglucanase